jgi:serine/threonine protein kinase
MTSRNLYDDLGVATDADDATIKRAYRRVTTEHHPDLHPNDPCAAERFRLVRAAYEVLGDSDKRALYDRTGSASAVTIRSREHTYRVGARLCQGDVADLLDAVDETNTTVVVKGARDHANDDLLANEAARLQSLARADQTSAARLRYIQPLRDTFTIRDSSRQRRTINVFERLGGWHTLEAIRVKRPALPIEHAAWMFNRLLEGLGFIHRHGLVHGAVVPAHVMAFASTADPSPWDHGVKLIDWCYAVESGQPLAAFAPKWKDVYAPEVFAKRPVTPAADIFMLRHYGRKKYVHFALPDTN